MSTTTEVPPMNGQGNPANVGATPTVAMPTLKESVAALNKARKETNDEVIESKEFVDAMFLAVASRTHVYAVGEGGVGKTFGAERLGKHFGVETFYTQFRPDMKREEVFGPLSMQGLQLDVYEHVTKGYLPEAVVANLDEIKDGMRFNRQLLPVLNERRFVNGGRLVEIPLVTAVGTTNFWMDEPELDALFDRFAQRLKVEPVKTSRGFLKILDGQLERDRNDAMGVKAEDSYTRVTPAQLSVIITAVRMCAVDQGIKQLVDELRVKAAADSLTISPRRWGDGIRLAKANAILSGRDTVIEDDLRVFSRVLRNSEDDFKLARDLTKNFRDRVTTAVEDATSVLAEIRASLKPVREQIDSGGGVDYLKLSDVSKATNKLREKINEAKAANTGRDLSALDAVEADLEREEEWMMTAAVPGRGRKR
jgi:MoxR-like ATPase